jgi:hypothetical protein
MEKKQMLTGLYFIPKSNDACNVFGVVDKIVQQLGYLNCETQDDAAVVKYNGVLSQVIKTKLTDLADDHDFVIAYIEAEYETPFAACDTVHIPTDDEMKEHLNWN